MMLLLSRGGCSQWCKEVALLAVFVSLACPIGYGQPVRAQDLGHGSGPERSLCDSGASYGQE